DKPKPSTPSCNNSAVSLRKLADGCVLLRFSGLLSSDGARRKQSTLSAQCKEVLAQIGILWACPITLRNRLQQVPDSAMPGRASLGCPETQDFETENRLGNRCKTSDTTRN